jgi:hypothetical protein
MINGFESIFVLFHPVWKASVPFEWARFRCPLKGRMTGIFHRQYCLRSANRFAQKVRRFENDFAKRKTESRLVEEFAKKLKSRFFFLEITPRFGKLLISK